MDVARGVDSAATATESLSSHSQLDSMIVAFGPGEENMLSLEVSKIDPSIPNYMKPKCQQNSGGPSPQNSGVNDKTPRIPTAEHLNMREMIVTSQADEGSERKSRQNRLKRVGWLTAGIVSLTVVLLVLV